MEERGHQVKKMGDIYRNAARVLIWLGLDKDDSEKAMDALGNPNLLRLGPKPPEASSYLEILALCERTYWRRVWVQQEIYLAGSFVVFCGKKQVYDEHFFDSLSVFAFDEKIHNSPARKLLMRTQTSLQRTNKLEVWLRLCFCAGYQTSEPRDLIYAMLSISIDCQNGEIIPDYDKPLLHVYLETVAFCESKRTSKNTLWFRRTLAEKLGIAFDKSLQGRVSEYVQLHNGVTNDTSG
jgi:hypothetical protein